MSERIANAFLAGHAAGAPEALPWNADTGLLLEGMDATWYNSAHGDYFRFVKQVVDANLARMSSSPDGTEPEPADALMARQFLLFYRATLKPEYFRAASIERQRELAACEGSSGTRNDPAHSICIAQPILAEYARVFDSPGDFAVVTASFAHAEQTIAASLNSGDTEQKEDEARRSSLELTALVDSLPYYPPDNLGRAQLLEILHRAVAVIRQHQDARTGLIYVAWQGAASTNSDVLVSSNCLLVYAILKAVRLGYLPLEDAATAQRAWRSVQQRLIRIDATGNVQLVALSHDSGANERGEGSASSTGDAGLDGALLLASTEADLAPTATLARGKIVLLDAWYNSQQRKNAAEQMEYFHYKWTDYADSGYALLGHLFRSFGAKTDTLYSAPTSDDLKSAGVYIIASPDIPVKNPNPHYMNDQDAAAIAQWVKQGGVLVMMENDPPNADINHLNLLADQFGIHFDDVLHHHILGEHVEDGTMHIVPGGPLFREEHTIYMKDTCAISLKTPAVALFRDRGDVVMATAKYGRGTVFAAVDPWLYNEYTDGRKNPKIYGQFDNFAAGREFVHWLLLQMPREAGGIKENERQVSRP